jgi:myo-inositol-1-phosphate synthase
MTVTGPASIASAEGKVGVLCVGLGAVTSTLIAGVELAPRGMGEPIGLLTQLGTIRLGTRTENRVPLIRDFVSLAQLDDLVFCAWDVFPDDAWVPYCRANSRTTSSLRTFSVPVRGKESTNTTRRGVL